MLILLIDTNLYQRAQMAFNDLQNLYSSVRFRSPPSIISITYNLSQTIKTTVGVPVLLLGDSSNLFSESQRLRLYLVNTDLCHLVGAMRHGNVELMQSIATIPIGMGDACILLLT